MLAARPAASMVGATVAARLAWAGTAAASRAPAVVEARVVPALVVEAVLAVRAGAVARAAAAAVRAAAYRVERATSGRDRVALVRTAARCRSSASAHRTRPDRATGAAAAPCPVVPPTVDLRGARVRRDGRSRVSTATPPGPFRVVAAWAPGPAEPGTVPLLPARAAWIAARASVWIRSCVSIAG